MNRRTLPVAPSSRLAKQRSSTSRPWADLDELEPEATALATETPSRMSRPTRAREAARTGEATAAGAVGAEGGEGDKLEEGVGMPAELGIGVEAKGEEGDEGKEGLKVPAELGVDTCPWRGAQWRTGGELEKYRESLSRCTLSLSVESLEE